MISYADYTLSSPLLIHPKEPIRNPVFQEVHFLLVGIANEIVRPDPFAQHWPPLKIKIHRGVDYLHTAIN